MYDYWVVKDKTTGRIIANCGEEKDARMLFEFDPDKRFYEKKKIILDQVIDITSETDKQLPGQLGLPAFTEKLKMQQDVWLPEGKGYPVKIN